MRRATLLIRTLSLLLGLSASVHLAAQAPVPVPAPAPVPSAAAAGTAVEPFLWKIETPTPSYLYGTIHVPDERVLAWPPAVSQAFAAADAVFTEIPMDLSTQSGIAARVMLPGDQTLADVIGTPLAERFSQTVTRSVPASAPPGTAGLLTTLLNRMKPWAAMSQLSVIEFLPDFLAGRQPLDGMLWTRAREAGKEVAALETVDEQLAVFEQFTLDEQKRFLVLTLDAMDADRGKATSTTHELIAAYLTGNLDTLTAVMHEAMKGDTELMTRFTAVALDARNELMTRRIQEAMAARPGKVCLFAVGTAHYAGAKGIIAQLERAKVPVSRVR